MPDKEENTARDEFNDYLAGRKNLSKAFVNISFDENPRLNTIIGLSEHGETSKTYYTAYIKNSSVYLIFPSRDIANHNVKYNLLSGIYIFDTSRCKFRENSVFYVIEPCKFERTSGNNFIAAKKGRIFVANI